MKELKHLDEHLLRHYLNDALNHCLEREEVKINNEKLAHDRGLEYDYHELLNKFEDHIKLIIKVSKGVNNEN